MNEDLKEAFDNEGWTATDSYREVMLEHAASAEFVLELGTGLTSLDLARAGVAGIGLEHLPEWFGYLQGVASAMGIERSRFKISLSQLKDFGDYEWYDFKTNMLFDFIVCDGPPRGSTKGGRYGLLPQLVDAIASPTYILYDDYIPRNTDEISANVLRWQDEFNVTVEEVWTPEDGLSNPFALLRIP